MDAVKHHKAKKLQLIRKEDLDVDVMAEVELARLQRQYRIMEGDREAYMEETNVKLARQQKVSISTQRERDKRKQFARLTQQNKILSILSPIFLR